VDEELDAQALLDLDYQLNVATAAARLGLFSRARSDFLQSSARNALPVVEQIGR
jgi:hypothetical protein